MGPITTRAYPSDPISRFVGIRSALLSANPVPTGLLAAGIGILLWACWFLAMTAGGASHASMHWFYIPIVLGAACFGVTGAILWGGTAALLAGPLMPADLDSGSLQALHLWVPRAIAFILVGALIAVLIERAQRSAKAELALAVRERELLVRKAGIISTVSHEFRTPLTVIRGVVRTLESQELVPQGRDLLQGLAQASRRLEDLVGAVLAAAEDDEPIGVDRRADVDLDDLIGEVLGQLAELSAIQRCTAELGPDARVVNSDAMLLRQLLRQILDNALRYSSGGGVVISSSADVDGVLIEVLDDGPGFDEDFLPRAFDPFDREDLALARDTGGLGIGLLAVSRLAALLGGTVSVANRPEGGAAVRLRLPA